jgi:hypothetical protein
LQPLENFEEERNFEEYFVEETLEKEDIVENHVEEVVHVVGFEQKEGYFEETLEKEDIVENDAEEVVLVVDFEETL